MNDSNKVDIPLVIDSAKQLSDFEKSVILAMIQSGTIKLPKLDFTNDEQAGEVRSRDLYHHLQLIDEAIGGLPMIIQEQAKNA